MLSVLQDTCRTVLWCNHHLKPFIVAQAHDMGLSGLLARVVFPGCFQRVCVQEAQRNELATGWLPPGRKVVFACSFSSPPAASA